MFASVSVSVRECACVFVRECACVHVSMCVIRECAWGGGGCVYHSVSEEGSEPVHLTLPLIVMKGRVSASIRPL